VESEIRTNKQTAQTHKNLIMSWNKISLFIYKILPLTVKQLQLFCRASTHQRLLVITELSIHRSWCLCRQCLLTEPYCTTLHCQTISTTQNPDENHSS